MSMTHKQYQKNIRAKNISASAKIFLSFLAVIIIGALFLMLPVASRSGEVTSFLDAFFTSTSAVCVTGLVTLDISTHWNLFGQIVILFLIQIGGLGLMTLMSVFSYVINSRISLQQRQFLTEAASIGNDTISVKYILRYVFFGTFGCEILGAAIISFTFVPEFGWGGGIYRSIFLAVSAFCNAGLDPLGTDKGEFTSLIAYADKPMLLIPLMILIIIGGLGFFVWHDIVASRKWSRFNLHTKVVLITTFGLIITGALVIFLFEYSNPQTFADMTLGEKIAASFFQGITPRTAGFAVSDISDMNDGSVFITMCLMLVGGAPGSTAGGIKVTTLAIIVMSAVATTLHREDVNIFKKRIDASLVQRAVTILLMYSSLIIVSTLLLCGLSDIPLVPALFETTSALGTVGLSMGVTPFFNSACKIILIVLMYLGRVGLLTLTITLLRRNTTVVGKGIHYPKGKLFI